MLCSATLQAMQRITIDCHDLPLLASQSTRELERRAQAELPAYTLMQRAGQATAKLALALAPHGRGFFVFCGPGNNGGDGLAAARILHLGGHRVQVYLAADPARLPCDAATALRLAKESGVPMLQALPSTRDLSEGLLIDALLGIGFRPTQRSLPPELQACLSALRSASAPILSIDLPSGLSAETGEGPPWTLRATTTLALLSLKPGLFTGLGRDLAGEVWWDDLAFSRPQQPDAWLSSRAQPLHRRHDQHKGSFGDVSVIGGAPGMRGAALLAARAAHASGAGRVFVSLLDSQEHSPQSEACALVSCQGSNAACSLALKPDGVVASRRHSPSYDSSSRLASGLDGGGIKRHLSLDTTLDLDPTNPALMFRRFNLEKAAEHTLVCGCGGGAEIAGYLPGILNTAARLVIDADGLNAVAASHELKEQLRGRAGAGKQTILTPHPLEAARLLQCSSQLIQADRLTAAQRLADELQCVVVLKGSGTVIAAPESTPLINLPGNAALASPGTGDVLAGWMGGWWSQCAGAVNLSGLQVARQVARDTVALHGRAAEPPRCGPLRASDLIERMHTLLRSQPNSPPVQDAWGRLTASERTGQAHNPQA
jgi:hydroxyethylthiazole kinase-like uncharacterized protein yjeF